MPSNPNVVFICVDCLRADLFEHNLAETPFLDRIIDDSTYFSNMQATANTTTPAVASFLTGTYSETNNVHSLRNVELAPGIKTLAEYLSDQGYETHAEVTGPLTDETGINRGFDTYSYREKDQELIDGYNSQILDTISQSDHPFFLYLHLWELHHPVEVSSEFDSPTYGRISYERKLSELDRALEKLVGSIPEDTIVVLLGDHGEGLTWRGTAAQYLANQIRSRVRFDSGIDTRGAERIANSILSTFSIDIKDHPIENGHGECIYDFVSNVPFLIYNSDLPSNNKRVQCRHIDIVPTLLDLLNITKGENLEGESLLPISEAQHRVAYMRSCGSTLHGRENWARAIRSQEYKYIEYPDRPWEPELYDLEEDPMEMHPIDNSDVMRELQSKLPDQRLEHTRQLDNKEKLKDLGYL